MDVYEVRWREGFDKPLIPADGYRVYRAAQQSEPVKSAVAPVRKDFLTIPEIAERWRIARPTVYNRLLDAGVRVLDFADKGARGRKIVPFGAILEIERQQLKRL